MAKTLTATDRSALIRLASTMEAGSQERRAILAGVKHLFAAEPDKAKLLKKLDRLKYNPNTEGYRRSRIETLEKMMRARGRGMKALGTLIDLATKAKGNRDLASTLDRAFKAKAKAESHKDPEFGQAMTDASQMERAYSNLRYELRSYLLDT